MTVFLRDPLDTCVFGSEDVGEFYHIRVAALYHRRIIRANIATSWGAPYPHRCRILHELFIYFSNEDNPRPGHGRSRPAFPHNNQSEFVSRISRSSRFHDNARVTSCDSLQNALTCSGEWRRGGGGQ
ncbi:hypothetical protein ElyMa_004800000 [Elysia marginata]|uniref:Uncharacterized protein n=1 Tax=Elysia marginata TaxID=1093978 RepID=A0AAV4II71_9GAST|nr:hypothetical protein ElyMa_004800000 [Elysia marginata]